MALFVEPAWYASTPPISRPSATGAASWAATRAKPLPCARFRRADRLPPYTQSTSASAVLPRCPWWKRLEQPDLRDAGNLEVLILRASNVQLLPPAGKLVTPGRPKSPDSDAQLLTDL